MKCLRLAELYGTTVDSLLRTDTAEGIGQIPPGPAGKHLYGTVTVNERGQMVIPKAARDQFGITGGTLLVVLADDAEGIALIPAGIFEQNMKQISQALHLRADK